MDRDQEIWKWTLTKEAISPCFVRDVFAMRPPENQDFDFFWLGHTPCRTVLLVGMVVGIQVYEKRTLYTIDDGTAVVDCVLRHPQPPTLPESRKAPISKQDPQRPSPKKARLDKSKLELAEPPSPIAEPGYAVRVVGRVVRHYQSRQVHADSIDPCSSSMDEITHLERVIDLHKTKYSHAVPFVPPPKGTLHATSTHTSNPSAVANADASVFSNASSSVHSSIDVASYVLPPPPVPQLLQNRNRAQSGIQSVHHDHTLIPSSPTASSIASSTPSSPCKSSSPVRSHDAPSKPKLRHPSRLHTRDLTGNTFRLYVKHYMDNAPPPFPTSFPSPFRGMGGELSTPTKRERGKDEYDEPTPRPRTGPSYEAQGRAWDGNNDGAPLGFTLSHLRRVPELALLAARVVRAESRKREKQQGNRHSGISSSSSGAAVDPPGQKMKRLFKWAIVKLHEEGSIVIWDGEVRPLPMPPPPDLEEDQSGLWKRDDTRSTLGAPSAPCSRTYATSAQADVSTSTSALVFYTSSASASLYSHYIPPRQSTKGGQADGSIDADADPGYVSDPMMDEDAYVPLTPRFLAVPVREAAAALRRRGGKSTEPTAEAVLAYMRRTNDRWARVGVWAIEEALAMW